MKRLFALLLAAAMALCLSACSLLPIDTDPYGTEGQQSPTASPTKTPAKTLAPSPSPSLSPTPVVSPSPSPTIPPEQERYDMLLGYCKDYLDFSAAAEIKGMFDDGGITEAQFEALYDIWGETADYSPDDWTAKREEIRSLSDIINGLKRTLEEQEGETFYETMCVLPQQGAAYIDLFDTQQKQDRVKAAVDLIKKWYAEPTEDNLKSFEDAFYSEDLTPGEVFMLGYYMYYGKGMPARVEADGTSVNTIDFISQKGYLEQADTAYYELIDINNGR